MCSVMLHRGQHCGAPVWFVFLHPVSLLALAQGPQLILVCSREESARDPLLTMACCDGPKHKFGCIYFPVEICCSRSLPLE